MGEGPTVGRAGMHRDCCSQRFAQPTATQHRQDRALWAGDPHRTRGEPQSKQEPLSLQQPRSPQQDTHWCSGPSLSSRQKGSVLQARQSPLACVSSTGG